MLRCCNLDFLPLHYSRDYKLQIVYITWHFPLLACTIAGYQIFQHLRYYSQPAIQIQIIRILSMIPVYSGATFLSILYPEWTLVCNTVRDIYEAYVLYIFMQLLVQFLGGENSLIVHLEFKRRIKQPWPLDKLRPLQTDK